MPRTSIEAAVLILVTMGAMTATAQTFGEQFRSLVRSWPSLRVLYLVKPESVLVPVRVVALLLAGLAVRPVIGSVVILRVLARSVLLDR